MVQILVLDGAASASAAFCDAEGRSVSSPFTALNSASATTEADLLYCSVPSFSAFAFDKIVANLS